MYIASVDDVNTFMNQKTAGTAASVTQHPPDKASLFFRDTILVSQVAEFTKDRGGLTQD